MAKALANELREATKANDATFQFNYHDVDRAKEQYLDKVEGSTDTSKKSQLKRKIVVTFDSNTAYELLNSCSFIGIVDNSYQIKLLKNITLSEYVQDKILQQVRMIYGRGIKQLQIIPFVELKTNQHNIVDENYLLELSKQLDSESRW